MVVVRMLDAGRVALAQALRCKKEVEGHGLGSHLCQNATNQLLQQYPDLDRWVTAKAMAPVLESLLTRPDSGVVQQYVSIICRMLSLKKA